jgi:hypothetical protein
LARRQSRRESRATAFSTSQINLSWTDEATNETGYRIQRRLTSDTSDTALSVVADLARQYKAYQNKELTDTTGYTYVVSAIAPGGALVSAAEVSATTYGPTAAPTRCHGDSRLRRRRSI